MSRKFEPKLTHEEAIERAKEIVEQLSVEERIELIGGHDFFYIKEVKSANIPRLYMTDATQGINIRKDIPDQLEKSVAFPCPILLASTWNKKLSHEYAKSIGEECRAGGAHFLLGPGMNIYRISQNGRNFEYFGEDPYLAARMIENYVVGMQSTGTIATLKHFVANNTDFKRRKSNSVVDLRTLHEIYLPAFKAGIEAGAMAVMTSYNLVNGEYAAESEFVINNLLREQLGFKWLVMSDWWSIYNPEKAIKSGLSIDMPGHDDSRQPNLMELGNIYIRTKAKELLDNGKVSEKDINRMATNIVATSLAMGFHKRNQKDTTFLSKFSDHEQVALNTAREGIVLLRNKDNILPLDTENTGDILVTGQFVDTIATGGGAAIVKGYNNITMLEGLQEQFGDKVKHIKNPSDEDIKNARTVIVSIGTSDSEGWDTSFNFQVNVNETILKYASINSNIIVVVNSGGGRNMSAWNNKVKAILYAWYPGQAGNKALGEIISGKINPSGKLPITIEQNFKDSPGYGYIPEGEEIYTGWPNDFDPNYKPYDVHYKEGIFVGYRWYEKKQIKPLYPFGFGLSYTRFEYSNLQLENCSDNSNISITVKFDIKNCGGVAGMEVVQVYVYDKECSVDRPVKELKGFKKISLQEGAQTQVEIKLSKADFSYYNADQNKWVLEPGVFEVLVGSSSSDILLKGEIVLLHLHAKMLF